MERVDIKGLKVKTCHGVLEKEKVNPQDFLIDIFYEYDAYAAAQTDDIENAVNYSQVCRTAYDICKNNCFDLIEKLAYEISFAIMERFEKIISVSVTVHKPQAPVNLPFEDICVTAQLERVQTILSLGSNMGDRKAALDGAIAELGKIRGVKVLKVSDYIATKPYGGVAQNEFLNCAVTAECLISPYKLLQAIHGIESKFGRVREKRWGDRTLDIDIVFFGDKIISQNGLCVPHPDYVNRDFVLKPIKQIAPDFVCPLARKRISDM